MIAAAMGTREISLPKYVDLARTEADIERTLSPDQCPRLAAITESSEPIRARLHFEFARTERVGWTDEAHMRVSGQVSWQCVLACQRCPEQVPKLIECAFSAWLVSGEEAAATVSVADDDMQIIVLKGAELDLVELLEDELLLAIPAQVCVEDDCVNRPQTSFGDDSTGQAEMASQSPFAILRQLPEQDVDDTQ